MSTLSVVIPAYNEEEGIAEIVHRVLAVGPALKAVGVANLELLVVDDASKDRTAEIVNGIEGVRLIRHAKNRGYGGALKNGFSPGLWGIHRLPRRRRHLPAGVLPPAVPGSDEWQRSGHWLAHGRRR